jgi:hypothetical protein
LEEKQQQPTSIKPPTATKHSSASQRKTGREVDGLPFIRSESGRALSEDKDEVDRLETRGPAVRDLIREHS